MKNIIELKINNSITRLAGNPFGVEVYTDQAKQKIDYNKENVIIFPLSIEDIAISFVQGFTLDIFNTISKDEFYKYFVIEGNEKVKEKFRKAIYY
ncbi:hypothetical protein FDA33_05785 [Clostridium botulinum]|nr:hypothetical protein [Clostridium botulinum]NFI17138.1 hypothetical protein [Clostridium botulinum]NFL92817.1 hypothetical protein [Clostridium botulinum]NFN51551.1 hypothetical protein [Clostridium botulinum]NFO27512.1 hypothetical protein [Clostridium botulinum]